MREPLRAELRALGAGFGGAGLAAAAGLPAAPLIGASLAVSAAAAAGLRLSLRAPLAQLAFAAIGVSLGAGVEPTILEEIARWGASLALLVVSLLATLMPAAAMLRRVFGFDPDTATLASTPGTMTYALAVTEEGRGDPIQVLILQSLRLLLLAAALPLLLSAFVGLPPLELPKAPMGVGALALLLAASFALGRLLGRLGTPAPALVSGMLLSGLAHAFGWISGPPPAWAVFLSFALAGIAIGARFSGVSLGALRRLAVAALATVSLAAAVSALFAFLAAGLTGAPFGQAWIAFAPGGVEAMAAIGLALGYDPAFVALHHIVRIAALVAIVPLLLGRRAKG